MPGKRPDGRLQAYLAKSAIALRPATPPVPSSATSCTRLPWADTSRRSGGGTSRSSAYHEGAFNPHRWQIITAGQADIGMLDAGYRPGEIYLSRIEIHPGHQGHGIGSRIISTLLEEAQRQGQDLVLDGPARSATASPVRRAQRGAQRNRRDAARSHPTLLAGPDDRVL